MGHEASLICHIIRCRPMQVSTRCTMSNVSFSVPWSTYVAAENEATCRVAPSSVHAGTSCHQTSTWHTPVVTFAFLLVVSLKRLCMKSIETVCTGHHACSRYSILCTSKRRSAIPEKAPCIRVQVRVRIQVYRIHRIHWSHRSSFKRWQHK